MPNKIEVPEQTPDSRATADRHQQACSLTIAFDIDGTWTLSPGLFFEVAYTFKAGGWQVIVVTGREQPHEKLRSLGLLGLPVLVSGPLLKEEAAKKAGYNVNVWVDDMPGMIQNCRILGGDLESENDKLRDAAQ